MVAKLFYIGASIKSCCKDINTELEKKLACQSSNSKKENNNLKRNIEKYNREIQDLISDLNNGEVSINNLQAKYNIADNNHNTLKNVLKDSIAILDKATVDIKDVDYYKEYCTKSDDVILVEISHNNQLFYINVSLSENNILSCANKISNNSKLDAEVQEIIKKHADNNTGVLSDMRECSSRLFVNHLISESFFIKIRNEIENGNTDILSDLKDDIIYIIYLMCLPYIKDSNYKCREDHIEESVYNLATLMYYSLLLNHVFCKNEKMSQIINEEIAEINKKLSDKGKLLKTTIKKFCNSVKKTLD